MGWFKTGVEAAWRGVKAVVTSEVLWDRLGPQGSAELSNLIYTGSAYAPYGPALKPLKAAEPVTASMEAEVDNPYFVAGNDPGPMEPNPPDVNYDPIPRHSNDSYFVAGNDPGPMEPNPPDVNYDPIPRQSNDSYFVAGNDPGPMELNPPDVNYDPMRHFIPTQDRDEGMVME